VITVCGTLILALVRNFKGTEEPNLDFSGGAIAFGVLVGLLDAPDDGVFGVFFDLRRNENIVKVKRQVVSYVVGIDNMQ